MKICVNLRNLRIKLRNPGYTTDCRAIVPA
jgi:hypothetical protein